MTKQTIPERMIKLETLMEQSLSEIKEIRIDLKHMSNSFVTKTEFKEEIIEIRNQVGAISKRSWIQNTLSAILGAVLTLLVSYFISNIGK